MNAHDILDMIGDAKGTYVWDAQQIRSGATGTKVRKTPAKIIWLIAAVIALTLLLVGCAVVYMLRMQDIKVGELSHYMPVDEDGNVISSDKPQSITLLSLQGVHLDAMSEWVTFTENYDRDRSIELEAERTGSAQEIPEQYSLTYGCYSQEMVDMLNNIAEKYDLNLLSAYVPFKQYQSNVLFDALQINSVCLDKPFAQVTAMDGYFYPEGTFELNLSVSLDGKDWQCTDNLVTYRYSSKDYFDPIIGSVSDPESYTQWDYTREDGITVLLAMNKEYARMYADLPGAFISVSMEACEWENGGLRIPMTKVALEQIAELFDFTIRPQQADMKTVTTLMEHSNSQLGQNSLEMAGYTEIVEDYISRIPNPENGSYLLYDLNGDGTEELLINGWGVYTMRGGKPYAYVDTEKLLTIFPQLRPCKGNVLEIYTDIQGLTEKQHYFYRAEANSLTYIIGVAYNSNAGVWNLIPDDDPWTESNRQISEEEAQQILATYTPVDFDWYPITKYGEDYIPTTYSDPYAQYIANKLIRDQDAAQYTYLLIDLTGDGVDELITRDKRISHGGQDYLMLNVFTIRDGDLVELSAGHTFSYILEGGILEETEELYGAKNAGGYWNYFRCTAEGVVSIEKIVRDPSTSVWGRVDPQNGGRDVSEEEAVSVIRKYSEMRMEPDMTPFADYPMK